MSWTSVGEFELTDDWQFSEPVEGHYFRVRFVSPPTVARMMIAQAETGQTTQLFQTQKLTSNVDHILDFQIPPFFTNRRIALKKSRLSPSWNVVLEVSDEIMPSLADHLSDINAHAQYVAKSLMGASSNVAIVTQNGEFITL